jgi:hypothetical protein
MIFSFVFCFYRQHPPQPQVPMATSSQHVPFSRVAVAVEGPKPDQYRFTLMVVDFVTGSADMVPLQKLTPVNLASSLSIIFAR